MARISGMKLAMDNEADSKVKTEAVKLDTPPAALDHPAGAPLYLQLHRKETRLREDQVDGLSVLARKLHRAKSGPGERITDNTLIRVAVDLLLSRADQLHGADESALRKSVGL